MGVLRLYLAICVVCGHSGDAPPWTLHDGRGAVQAFFIISGFYMQFILGGGKYQSVRDFYVSRAIRIFTPYYLVLAAVVLVSVLSGLIFREWLTLQATVDEAGALSSAGLAAVGTNLTLFFQDWVMFFREDSIIGAVVVSNLWEYEPHLFRFLWIPQAWSIGVELTFYLIAPFLVRRFSTAGLVLLTGILLALRVACWVGVFGPGWNSDPWDYRFFPFELAHFCYGMLACRIYIRFRPSLDRLQWIGSGWIYPALAIGLLLMFWSHHAATVHFKPHSYHFLGKNGPEWLHLASLVPWIVVVPILFAITSKSRIDRFIGELSYPVYLVHFTIALIVLKATDRGWIPSNLAAELSTIVSVLCAVVLQTVLLSGVERWRQRVANHHAFTA